MHSPWFCHLNKYLKWWMWEPSADHVSALRSWTDHVIALRLISVTVPCYSSILLRSSRKIHSRGVRAYQPKAEEKREPWPLGSFFLGFFLALGLPYVNWASQECCLFYLRSSLWSSDFALTFLCSVFMGFFPSLSFSHHHFGLLFSILTT